MAFGNLPFNRTGFCCNALCNQCVVDHPKVVRFSALAFIIQPWEYFYIQGYAKTMKMLP